MFRKALFLTTFLCLAKASSAQGLLDAPSIKGVNQITLTVNAFGGLDEESIRQVASQELVAANIEVVSKAPTSSASSLPMLNLVVTLACAKDACGYTTRLWLEESVKLVRQSSPVAKATTWANGYQNAIPKADVASLPSLISVDIKVLIRLFAAEVSGKI